MCGAARAWRAALRGRQPYVPAASPLTRILTCTQAFYRVMNGVPEHLMYPFWQLYMRVRAAEAATALEAQ